MSPVEKSRMSPVEVSNNSGGEKKLTNDFKTVFFKDSKDSKDVEKVEKVEEEEKPDEFKKLLASLKEEVYKLENGEVKSKISRYFKSLEKVNDEELKNSLFIIEGIIDRVRNLIEKYETQSDSDEETKETKESILMIIKNIEKHCEKYIRQVQSVR